MEDFIIYKGEKTPIISINGIKQIIETLNLQYSTTENSDSVIARIYNDKVDFKTLLRKDFIEEDLNKNSQVYKKYPEEFTNNYIFKLTFKLFFQSKEYEIALNEIKDNKA